MCYSGLFEKGCSLHTYENYLYRGKLVELYMSRIVCLHGVPKKIVSDRGT
jgi:hypothetical protein